VRLTSHERETGTLTTISTAGINLLKADDFSTWWFTIEVMGDSLYQVLLVFPVPDASDSSHARYKSEVHTLQFRFDAQYPISSPAVQFLVTDGRESPIHPVRSPPFLARHR
jgi:ubiquitin-conjugating enzyme E2 W